MTNPHKNKGDKSEREVAAMLTDMLGYPVRRKLGAGRKDDIGDLDGLPNTVIQVTNKCRINEAVRYKPLECEEQRRRAGEPFAATFIKLVGGEYRVVLTVEQFCAWYREATS